MDRDAFKRACKEGGDAIATALLELDRAFYAALHRDCMRVLHDADLARDVVQEAFIKVWRRCASYQGDSELLPWVRSIARNTLLDCLRRQRPTVVGDFEGEVTPEVERAVATLSKDRRDRPDDELRRAEAEECFARGWARFEQASPQHAAVLAWVVEDGLSNDDVAALLGRTAGATREFVSQCRKRARMHLAEWYQLTTDRGEDR